MPELAVHPLDVELLETYPGVHVHETWAVALPAHELPAVQGTHDTAMPTHVETTPAAE